LRIAFIGHGAVSSVHARGLATHPEVTLAAVFGPDRTRAEAFAADHGVMHVGNTIEEAILLADLAIVCSPSPLHYRHAFECLNYGVNTLVEMPPCDSSTEAEDLETIARQKGVKLQCAHTSRYLTPYKRITECIRRQDLGIVQQVSYLRHFTPRKRNWHDDALLHHSAHPVDLLLYWFGDILPKSCVALPGKGNPESVSMLAELPNGAPASISVSYSSRLPHTRMFIVGEHHTVETDGFSYLHSDLDTLNLATPEVETYEDAICEQDLEFVSACRGGNQSIVWKETITLLKMLNIFQAFRHTEFTAE
jgi:2-hydroxy-4-carboxymuconate semialdehyde hemiacetal dehydrogenase